MDSKKRNLPLGEAVAAHVFVHLTHVTGAIERVCSGKIHITAAVVVDDYSVGCRRSLRKHTAKQNRIFERKNRKKKKLTCSNESTEKNLQFKKFNRLKIVILLPAPTVNFVCANKYFFQDNFTVWHLFYYQFDLTRSAISEEIHIIFSEKQPKSIFGAGFVTKINKQLFHFAAVKSRSS